MTAPIELGQIVGVHGVRGWVKIYSDCRPREAIFKHKRFIAKWLHGEQELILSQGRNQTNGLVAKFVGIDDRDQALALMGVRLWVSQLPKLPKGQYYWADLIGLTVRNLQNETLGTVKELFETGANDVVVVENNGEEILIPYAIPQYIQNIDLENKIMTVDWDLSWND